MALPSINPTNARIFYQQNVCHFLSSNKSSPSSPCPIITSWIAPAARSIALRSIASAARNENEVDLAAATAAGTAVPPRWDDFVCLTCGTLLFPPLNDTNIRSKPAAEKDTIITGKNENDHFEKNENPNFHIISNTSKIRLRKLKRGKTRRRRSSRYRALYFQKMQQLNQGSSNANVSKLLRRDGIEEQRNLRMAYMFRLGDGTSKQCLVMKCGYCGAERKFKGVDVCVRNGRQGDSGGGGGSSGIFNVGDATITIAAAAATGRNAKKVQSWEPMDAARFGVDRSVESQIRDGSNFISLCSLSESKSPGDGKRKQMMSAQSTAIATSSGRGGAVSPLAPLGNNKKKKKSKNDKNKKSNLMDFLSSLND